MRSIKDVYTEEVVEQIKEDLINADKRDRMTEEDRHKINNELSIPRAALIPFATCLLRMASKTEIEARDSYSQHAQGKWSATVCERGDDDIVLSLTEETVV